MRKLTSFEIEKKLLSGQPVSWQDEHGQPKLLTLATPDQRRLFEYLLPRVPMAAKDLPPEFIEGLATAYSGAWDPATLMETAQPSLGQSAWRIHSIETEGFGGLNTWNGGVFRLELHTKSLLLEGPNGSGKSSLVGAISWALTGERIRDQSNQPPHEPKPVFDPNSRPLNPWPPIATYPNRIEDLRSPPKVRVRLTFGNDLGIEAFAERTLEGRKVTYTASPGFSIPDTLLECGIRMPARLSQIKFGGGDNRIPLAIQSLTGLDRLANIGALVEGLTHRGREYLSFQSKDLKQAISLFQNHLKMADNELREVGIQIPAFDIRGCADPNGPMAQLGRELKAQVEKIDSQITSDVAANAMSEARGVSRIVEAIGVAKQAVRGGLAGYKSWQTLTLIAQNLSSEAAKRAAAAIEQAEKDLAEARRLLKRQETDTRLQVKATGAHWHHTFGSGELETCPLCGQSILENPALRLELDSLSKSLELATRSFVDNINKVRAELEQALPSDVWNHQAFIMQLEPRARIETEIRAALVTNQQVLKQFAKLVEEALLQIPSLECKSVLPDPGEGPDRPLLLRIEAARGALLIADWFGKNRSAWEKWWLQLAGTGENLASGAQPGAETLTGHLERLSTALAQAEPYRKATVAMREAWKRAKDAVRLQKEVARREAIAESLQPLKGLSPLVAAITADTGRGLSTRINDILKHLHIAESLQFAGTSIQRKEGLAVRGAVAEDFTIDATQIANTSWLRAVMWALLFAIREEAVARLGFDSFPVLVLDDPQLTFDVDHRHRWANIIMNLQQQASPIQVILTTHDEAFLELIKIDGVTGRSAVMSAANAELGHVFVNEGDFVHRQWERVKKQNTPEAAREFIGHMRIHVEGLLRQMLKGQGAQVAAVGQGFVIGNSRERIRQLHAKKAPPWNHEGFHNLAPALDKSKQAIQFMEIAHHSGVKNLGIGEAETVFRHWKEELWPKLDECLRIIVEHRRLYGGYGALASPSTALVLPEGYGDCLRERRLPLIGRASALSAGLFVHGQIEFDQEAPSRGVVLAQHQVFRLTRPTLEPVAREGDFVIVKTSSDDPTPRSLVVASAGGRIVARRLELAEDRGDLAVLTAHSTNPRAIADPLVGHRGTMAMNKIVGVIYGKSEAQAWPSNTEEIVSCVDRNEAKSLLQAATGLVEVYGNSAEPFALDRQYLILDSRVLGSDELKHLEGWPVIVSDSNDHHYFKRLHVIGSNVVLESLDSSGDHAPILLSLPNEGATRLPQAVDVWPVAGVLFELP